MANEGLAKTAGVVVLCGILLAAAASLQATREQNFPPRESDEESLYLTSGKTLRRVTGAYSLMASDLLDPDHPLRHQQAPPRGGAAGMALPPALAAVPTDQYR